MDGRPAHIWAFSSVAFCSLVFVASSPAVASDYGCKVLLCLANPAGPTAVSQCVPPITQLWRDLAHVPPRAFPACDEARPAIAVQTSTWYDPCPDGTSALEEGTYALQQGAPDSAVPALGIGTGDNLYPTQETMLSSKVCVGRQVGMIGMSFGSGENSTSALVNIYDRVAILDPATSPNAIDVYLNGALYRRVRW